MFEGMEKNAGRKNRLERGNTKRRKRKPRVIKEIRKNQQAEKELFVVGGTGERGNRSKEIRKKDKK